MMLQLETCQKQTASGVRQNDCYFQLQPASGFRRNDCYFQLCTMLTLPQTNLLAESICTHYSNLSGRPDIFLGSGTLKKQGPKYGVQNIGTDPEKK